MSSRATPVARVGRKAARLDLDIEQGATFELDLTWRDAHGRTVDLTGFVARLELRSSAAAADALLVISTPTGIVLEDQATKRGRFRLVIAAATTAALGFDSALYDLRFTDPAGKVIRVMEGAVRLMPAVTRG